MNTLYYGDNLKILREYFSNESIDLIYLDPPFNSNRSYNVLFKDEDGTGADTQIKAFDDSWHWGETAEETYRDLIQNAPLNVGTMIEAMRKFIGTNQMMAYLVMMAVRLIELRRVLKSTGSLFLHCDPTASHYLKILLDTIFGANNYQNEIIWKRKTGRGETNHQSNRFGICTDFIFFYSKSSNNIFNSQFNFEAAGYDDYVKKFFRHVDESGRQFRIDNLASPSYRENLIYEYKGYKPPKNGWAISKEKMENWDKDGKLYFPKSKDGRIQRKRYLDELKGKPVQNLWDDIEMISSQSNERLGFQTQKPLALLERIIQASSNPGDVVLDPFSGCGTAITAAQKLDRKWIGIDITHLAIAAHKSRLQDMFGLEPGKDYKVIGEPEDLWGAQQLAKDDRYQFQWWALSLAEARPLGDHGGREGKKGSDRGVDGIIRFFAGKDKFGTAIVQVKSGHVNSSHIRDLKGVLEREKAEVGIYITLENPTRDMETEALDAGYYHSDLWQKDFLKIQILTVEQLLSGKDPDLPITPPDASPYKQAEKVKKTKGEQVELGI